jgi:EAL domain-containing protein (putative c-di-GMP-specific phosphodiesterase class I)
VFRVPEPSVASHTVNAVRLLNGIRQMGSKVMIECVGGLNSSFANLKNLPADYLALDAALAAAAPSHRTDRAMVAAIKQWAVVLGIKCVAYGVDTNEALKTVNQIGIDWVRGDKAGATQTGNW